MKTHDADRRNFCKQVVTLGVGLGAALTATAQSPAPKTQSAVTTRGGGDPDVPLEVLFRGTGSPGLDLNERRGGACEIIFAHGEPLLFDLGHLGLANLAQAGFHPADIQRLFFTHTYHYDHFADFEGFAMTRNLQRGPAPLHVYGPADTADRINLVLRQVYAEDIRAQNLVRFDTVKIHHVDNGVAFQTPKLTVTTVHVKHGPNALGYRIDAGGKSVTISGDIAEPQSGPGRRIAGFPCESIEKLASGTDLFIMDACPMHSSPEEIAAAAARAKPKKVVLTHVRDTVSAKACREVVQKMFGGEVVIAENLMRIRV